MSEPDFELPTVELPYVVAAMDGVPSGDVVAQDGGFLVYPEAGTDQPVQWVQSEIRINWDQLGAIVSSHLNLVPIYGQIKGVIEAALDRDLITGRNLAWWERALNVASIIPHVHGATGVLKMVGVIGHSAHRVNQVIHGKHAADVTVGNAHN
jgi:hypothetical protein